MRKMTLQDIQSKMLNNRQEVDLSIAKFREKSKNQGWDMSRTHPRSEDEIKALNYVARTTFRRGLKSERIQYNKERRVLFVERFAKS